MAASGAGGSLAASQPASQPASPRLIIYVFLWYAFNMVFNIVNKQTLNVFPLPWFLATWQLVASGLFMCFLWVTKLQPVPKISKGFVRAILPMALFHCVGHGALPP